MNQSVDLINIPVAATNENEVRGGNNDSINHKVIVETQKSKGISKSTERPTTRKRKQNSSANNNVQIISENIEKAQKENQQRVKSQKLVHKNKKIPKSAEGSSAKKREQNLGGSSPIKLFACRMRASNDPRVQIEESQMLHKNKKTSNSAEGSSARKRKQNVGDSSSSRTFTCRMRVSNDL